MNARRGISERGSKLKRTIDVWVGRPLIVALRLFMRRRTMPAKVSKIGLLMFGAIGDTILASALAHDLRRAFPSAKIQAFVSLANRSVFDVLDGFDEVIAAPISNPRLVISKVRAAHLDLLIDIGQWARISALVAMLGGARFTIGFRTRGQYRHLAFDTVADHSDKCHEITNFRALLGCLGIQAVERPRLKASSGSASIDLKQPFVIFHPWAAGFRSEEREWALENWIELAGHVHQWGCEIVITGGPGDKERSDSLAAALQQTGPVHCMAGRASLRETASMVASARAVVAVNTGVMHLAATLDRPMVALHGPTNHLRWGPLSRAAVVVGPGPDDGGAFLNLGFEYPAARVDCMSKISVAEVRGHLFELLDARPNFPRRRPASSGSMSELSV
jgi:heptosyltransferase-3